MKIALQQYRSLLYISLLKTEAVQTPPIAN